MVPLGETERDRVPTTAGWLRRKLTTVNHSEMHAAIYDVSVCNLPSGYNMCPVDQVIKMAAGYGK